MLPCGPHPAESGYYTARSTVEKVFGRLMRASGIPVEAPSALADEQRHRVGRPLLPLRTEMAGWLDRLTAKIAGPVIPT